MSDHDTHWSAKADWMRATGATEAAWATSGELVHLKLGPEPSSDGDSYEDPVESRKSPVEREQHARAERRRITLGSSGGPVKRLGADD